MQSSRKERQVASIERLPDRRLTDELLALDASLTGASREAYLREAERDSFAVLVARRGSSTSAGGVHQSAVGYAIVHELDEVFMVFTVIAQHPHTDGIALLLESFRIIAEHNPHSKVMKLITPYCTLANAHLK